MSHNRSVVDDIKDLNREVCRRLWQMASVGEIPTALAPHVIYAEYRRHNSSEQERQEMSSDGPTSDEELVLHHRRVSEQEARFAYAEVLAISGVYHYSVETPTEELYSFSGQTPLSARSDMSLYLPGESGLTKVANVELKAGNPPQSFINKDVQKLVREGLTRQGLHGNWFHLLVNADNGTFISLFSKFNKAFGKAGEYLDGHRVGDLSIVMCFCILGHHSEQRWAFLKHFTCPSAAVSYRNYAEQFLQLDTSAGLQAGLESAGWEAVRASSPKTSR